jgi:hypothetical protein
MDMKHELKALAGNMIYLKPIATADLPQEVRDQAGTQETLFAVHNTQGEQVALVANPVVASELAAANDMTLVTVH